MRVLIPFAPDDPKSRLEPIFDRSERRDFARCMLTDVVETTRRAGYRPDILATEMIADPPAPVTVDDRALSVAVNANLRPPTAIVMADLPLATPLALKRAFDAPGDIVLAPGRGGGTNVLVVRDDRFTVDFHGMSIADHRHLAAEAHLTVTEIDSMRLTTDVDEPEDLVEVLLHGKGASPEWLRERQCRLETTSGRVRIARD